VANLAKRSLTPVASAGLLYAFNGVFGAFAAVVVPWLLELWERSPRLGALGWLGLVTSPALFIALAHHVAHATMDRFDSAKKARDLRMASVRAGLFGWFAIVFSSMASALLLLAIFPPPPDEGAFASLLRVASDVRLQVNVHAFLWVGVAALLYRVDQDRGTA
jgi:hypothetical protein